MFVYLFNSALPFTPPPSHPNTLLPLPSPVYSSSLPILPSSLSQCDMVIEAVFEDIKVKRDVFQQLDGVCRANCILASNTSSLDIDIISSTVRQSR
jgi:3-hydroxyacyl-CoA dehydrogenase